MNINTNAALPSHLHLVGAQLGFATYPGRFLDPSDSEHQSPQRATLGDGGFTSQESLAAPVPAALGMRPLEGRQILHKEGNAQPRRLHLLPVVCHLVQAVHLRNGVTSSSHMSLNN